MPRPNISVATKMRFSKALNAVYRLILYDIYIEVNESQKVEQKHEPFLLLKSWMYTNAGEVARNKEFIELNSTSNGFDEDDNLRDNKDKLSCKE